MELYLLCSTCCNNMEHLLSANYNVMVIQAQCRLLLTSISLEEPPQSWRHSISMPVLSLGLFSSSIISKPKPLSMLLVCSWLCWTSNQALSGIWQLVPILIWLLLSTGWFYLVFYSHLVTDTQLADLFAPHRADPWLRSSCIAVVLHPTAAKQDWESDTSDNVLYNESLIKRKVLRGGKVPIKLNSIRPV